MVRLGAFKIERFTKSIIQSFYHQHSSYCLSQLASFFFFSLLLLIFLSGQDISVTKTDKKKKTIESMFFFVSFGVCIAISNIIVNFIQKKPHISNDVIGSVLLSDIISQYSWFFFGVVFIDLMHWMLLSPSKYYHQIGKWLRFSMAKFSIRIH